MKSSFLHGNFVLGIGISECGNENFIPLEIIRF